MRQSATRNLFLIAAATIVALACVPTLAPAPTPFPTFDETLLGTYIAETANAAATETQVFITPSATPTFTPTPTKTPSATPSPTPTFLYIVPSITMSPTVVAGPSPDSLDYVCVLLGQSPADNSLIPAGSPFSVRWQVKNTGQATWDLNNTDFRYKSGTKMHQQPGYDLYKNVGQNEVIDLIVDMTAPSTPGKYSTAWRLHVGKKEFCPVSVTVTVP